MDIACDYAKFGCRSKLANDDHLSAHLRDSASYHLKLVTHAFEREVEKSKLLDDKLDAIYKMLRDSASRENIKHNELNSHKSEVPTDGSSLSRSFKEEPVAVALPPKSPKEGEVTSVSFKPAAPSISEEPSAETPSILHVLDLKGAENKEKEREREDFLPIRRTQSSTSFSGAIGKRRESGQQSLTGPVSASPAAASPVSLASPDASPVQDASPIRRRNSNSKRRSQTGGVDEDLPEGFENGILWEYDPGTDEWSRGALVFKMEAKSFAEGALRSAHMVEVISTVDPVDTPPEPTILLDKTLKNSVPLELGHEQYVAKISKTPVPSERYFEDVKMQGVVRELAIKFNNQGTPKKVEFLKAWVLEIPRGTHTVLVGLEPFIAGNFQKISNNLGFVLSDRNTPQAFSHFTWEHSNHNLVVVDLQGVDDYYTDPQVHTKGGKDFGLGNLGIKGFETFLKTHKCNAICQQLMLPSIGLVESMAGKRRLMRGTMKAPNIEKDLATAPPLPSINVPAVLERGEFQCVQTLTGHDDRVICLVIHKQQLFSSTADGTVKIWALPACTVVNTIRAHRKSVESMCFSEKYLFTASADHAIKVWDIKDFTLIERLKDHTAEVNAACVNGDNLITASFDKSIKVWSISNLKCTNTLEGHSKSVKCLISVGNVVFSGSNDGTIKVWSLAKMQCIFSVDAHDQIWVKALAIKDYTLFSGAHDSLIKEWDLKNFAATITINDHSDNITSLLATQQFLFSASEDKTIKVWNYANRKCLATLKGHRSGVQSLTTDGKSLFSASDDYTIKVWRWVEK